MGRSAQPISPFVLGLGLAALSLVAFLLAAPIVALGIAQNGGETLTSADWRAIRFTIFQAGLSAIICIGLAIPAARALARRQFWGRGVLVILLGAPFLLPVIVAVLGLLAIWGRSGVLSQLLLSFGLDRLDMYGLEGILLAHVFFNLPLVVRLILQGWDAIPTEHFRLAAQLGSTPRDIQRQLEWPMLKSVLPGAFLLVFLLCMTSFAVALTLGGGPRATTIELAIFQAIRFDFDLSKAAKLGLTQFLICGVVAFFVMRTPVTPTLGAGINMSRRRWDVQTKTALFQDVGTLAILVFFIGSPLLAIILVGLPTLLELPSSIWRATFHSLMIAISSAGFALILGLSSAMLIDTLKARKSRLSTVAEVIGLLTLSASPFVLGTGLFLLIFPFADPFMLALPITALVNALISLPISLRAILPSLEKNRLAYGRLSDSLGLTGIAGFRIVVWPAVKRPLGFSMGLAAALSMGDLGVIVLFAPPDIETLPLLMYRLMGAYKMDLAASAALLLAGLSLGLFWMFDQGGQIGRST